MSGGRSASSSSSTASGDASGTCGGRRGGSCDTPELKLLVAERSGVDVAVLVGVSTACSMSSCLTISSASMAWSGESEPEEAGGGGREGTALLVRLTATLPELRARGDGGAASAYRF